jgi:purine-binding chemotaxis protein CheW
MKPGGYPQAASLALPDALPDKVASNSDLIVTCTIGPQVYGIAIDAVKEVVRLPALIALAGAPPFVCGMLNLRGSYLPVLNGRVLVDEPAHYDASHQVIIAGREAPEMGLLVDQVLEVYTVPPGQRTQLGNQHAAAFLRSVINTGNASVLLFDVEALLAMLPDTTE